MNIIVKKSNIDPDLWEALCKLVGYNKENEILGLQCQAYSPATETVEPFECFNDAYKDILTCLDYHGIDLSKTTIEEKTITSLAAQHFKYVNRYNCDRDWSCQYLCKSLIENYSEN